MCRRASSSLPIALFAAAAPQASAGFPRPGIGHHGRSFTEVAPGRKGNATACRPGDRVSTPVESHDRARGAHAGSH